MHSVVALCSIETDMQRRRVLSTIMCVGILQSCSVVEVGFDVPCRVRGVGPTDMIVRVWVIQDPGIIGLGEYSMWFDSVLWPIDACVSVVASIEDVGNARVRTRWAFPFCIIARAGAILLPGLTVLRSSHNLEWSIIGLGADPITALEVEGVTVEPGAGLEEAREAIVRRLLDNVAGPSGRGMDFEVLKTRVCSRIVGVEWVVE